MKNKSKEKKATMASLAPGDAGVVESIGSCGGLEERLRDMGMTEGCTVKCLGRSPLGDPCLYVIRGAQIALRASDVRGVRVLWG